MSALIFLHSFLIVTMTYCQNIDDLLPPYMEKFESAINITGGEFMMGVLDPKSTVPGEYPPRKREVDHFIIDKYPVTNAQFRNFTQTKLRFRTEAEIRGWSFVFYSAKTEQSQVSENGKWTSNPWWLPIKEARWNMPEGPGSGIVHKMDHPVVHVTRSDASAYCHWKGKRLPTEIEWEYASRGGEDGNAYGWGESYRRNRMNLWQGLFPSEDERLDGWHGTSPVDAFPPQNDYDMHDMLGNVWEWTSTKERSTNWNGGGLIDNSTHLVHILKGGSFTDTKEGLVGPAVRCATRTGLTASLSSQNIGFRCAKSIVTVKPTSGPRTHFFAEMHPSEWKTLQMTREQLSQKHEEL